jgi:uncharacterized protein YjiS (DUF1127 family)
MLPRSLHAGQSAMLPSPGVASARAGALFSTIRRMLHMVRVWNTRGASRRQLAMLSDHILRDIGLTRDDVDRELLKPFWRA